MSSLSMTNAPVPAFENVTTTKQWLLRRQYQRDYCQRIDSEGGDDAALIAADDADLLTWHDQDDSDDGSDADELLADVSPAASPTAAGVVEATTSSQDKGLQMNSASVAMKRRQLRNALLQRTIPLRFMLDYLQKRRDVTKATIELLLFIPLLFLSLNLFVFRSADLMDSCAYWGAALKTSLVDAPVTPQGFHTTDPVLSVDGPHYLLNFNNVRSSGEWGLWLQRVVVPFFFDPLHRAQSPSRPGPPVGQTVLASAIRLRTVRVRNDSCTVPPSLVSRSASNMFGSVPCYAAMSDDALDSSSVFINTSVSSGGGGGVELLPFEPTKDCGGYSSTLLQTRAEYRWGYGCGGYMFLLNGSLTFSDALDLTDAWLATDVVHNAATRFVSVDVILYHTALDAFQLIELSHEVTEGGSWYAYPRFSWFQVLSTNLGTYSASDRTSDAILAIFLVIGWFMFFTEWLVSFRRTGRSIGAFFFDPWTIVNATYLTCVSVSLILTWVQASAGADAFRSSLDKPPMFSSAYAYSLVRLARLYHWTRYFNGIAAVMLLLRVMEYFRLNGRLSILTRTLGRVAESIFGLVIVFCLFVVAFAMCGHVLYGSQLFQYSSMALSFANAMLSLMGSFDYAAMRRSDQPLTFVYFWAFIILGLFVLLNFMTAVISTAFDEERTHLRMTPLRIVLRRWRQQLTAVRPMQETLHLYVRCVKAFHSVSPNVLWNRLVQHVETSIALDEVLQHEQQAQRRMEMLRRNSAARTTSGGFFSEPDGANHRAAGASSTFSGAQKRHINRHELLDQLVGVQYFAETIGKEDLAVITVPHVESIFLAMLRAHDRLRPSTTVLDHWKMLDLVETVALERVKTFLTSTTIAGRMGRKAQRVAGKTRTSEAETPGKSAHTVGRTCSSSDMVKTALSLHGNGSTVVASTEQQDWVHEVLLLALRQRQFPSPMKTSAPSSTTPATLLHLQERVEQVTKLMTTLQ